MRTCEGEALGTCWRVSTADVAPPRAAIEAVLREVAAEMSAWAPASALSRFNAAPGGAWIALPPGLLAVLREALAVAEATGGAFDPTVGAAADAWGFGPSSPPTCPPDATPRPLGWRRLRIDAGGRAFQPGGLTLDVGGIGKGWAADRVAALLERRGSASHLVEVGGELRGLGLKPDGAPWMVALEPPRLLAPSPTVVALHRGALATSGDQHRTRTLGGRRYGHTLDPATGTPLADAPVQAVVWAEAAVRADALATALLVMGVARGIAWADATGTACLLTTATEAGVRRHASKAWCGMSMEGGG